MLDPELFAQLARHPEKNAPEVNLALAEEGQGAVLLALARSPAVHAEALRTIGERVARDGDALEREHEDDDEEHEPLVLELERLLIAHPNAPGDVRDAMLARHERDPFFVLAAATHAHATDRAIELAACWPCRYPVLDRPWIALMPGLAPLVAEAWAQDEDVLLRETVALHARAADVLRALARDPSRQVRRAVASNEHAAELRGALSEDRAVEVRARAAAPLGATRTRVTIDSPRFVAAHRAMQQGGVLSPDVAGALAQARADIDEEGAMLAARVLPPERVLGLVRAFSENSACQAAVGLAAGLALRRPDETGGEEGLRELVSEAAKALTPAAAQYGNLTGKARLATWIAEGIAASNAIDRKLLVSELCTGAVGGEVQVLARGTVCRPAMADELFRAANGAEQVPAALLDIAWRSSSLDDEGVSAMARRIARAKRRGQDLPDDELDLDPRLRSLPVLESVVLAASRHAVFSPRAAL
ncbi:MAG TPA: hypothetical protein VFB62_18050, partial [Polyangiaceae bacterium]|nr:hypothetical protein [Polyangiaceae bacterium]